MNTYRNRPAVVRDHYLDQPTLQAIRACARLFGEYLNDGSKVWEADRQFDAGEFSDSVICAAQQEEEHRIVCFVSERFDIPAYQLQIVWDYNYAYDQEWCQREAVGDIPFEPHPYGEKLEDLL